MAVAATKCTGAVILYAHVGGGLAQKRPLVLGTGERAPRVFTQRGWKPIYNDLGGSEIPFDRLYQREEAMFSIDLTFFDQDVFNLCRSVPSLSGLPGISGPFDVGTAMIGEGAAYPMTLVFTRAVVPAMRALKLPFGVRYHYCHLEGPDAYTLGTGSDYRANLIWRAQSGWDRKTGRFLLGSEDQSVLTGLPAFKG